MYHIDENGNILWVATGISSLGLIVNHDNLDRYDLPTPRTWEDLASPNYFLDAIQHAIGMGQTTSTTATRVYQTILQHLDGKQDGISLQEWPLMRKSSLILQI